MNCSEVTNLDKIGYNLISCNRYLSRSPVYRNLFQLDVFCCIYIYIPYTETVTLKKVAVFILDGNDRAFRVFWNISKLTKELLWI